jgi:hypothetical protein
MRLPRLQFTVRHLLALVAVVALLFFVYDMVVGEDWIGSFPLEVCLSGAADRKIVRVEVMGAYSLEDAPNPEVRLGLLHPDMEQVEWIQGRSFLVWIGYGGSNSGLGRELSYAQRHLLVVRITFEDGTVEWIHVKIPDGRIRRDVVVPIPERHPQA